MKTNKEILAKFISTQGYKRNSPDKNRPVNVIPSGDITMQDVDFPVRGVDNLGNEQLMMPGGEYSFPGDYVVETPAMSGGGEMIRRADGSYSRRGLWDNIRDNIGSGKKPTKEMLEQERKIREKQDGGNTNELKKDTYESIVHPSYKKRLSMEMFGDENLSQENARLLEEEYAKRLERLRTVSIETTNNPTGSYNDTENNKIVVYPGAEFHELSHSLERAFSDFDERKALATQDVGFRKQLLATPSFQNFTKDFKTQPTIDTMGGYITKPTEIKARINELRNFSKNLGYDYNDSWDIRKYKKQIQKSPMYKQQYKDLRSIFKDKDINKLSGYTASNLTVSSEYFQDGGAKISTGEADLMTEYGRKITRKFNQAGDYLMPASFVNKAADMAEAKGYGFGEDSEGPLDAVRHASAAASTASRLPVPSFVNSIIPGSEQKIREYGSRALGALYEMYYDNPEGREMDYYNNKIGAQIGSIPGLTDEQRLKLINKALTKDKLQIDNRVPINRKQQGGMTNEEMNIVDPEEQQSGPDVESAVAEISTMIAQGEDPSMIYEMLMESGLDDDQATDVIDAAMENLQEDEVEEEDVPMDEDDMMDFEQEPMYNQGYDEELGEMKKGGIKLDPAKKGTFKAQATRMGMSVQEAASYILRHKDDYSPAMVKKAAFAQNFAKELGGEIYDLEQFKNGGGIPDRYRKMGFTRVGAKKKSSRPGKKWMVLAKKGDQYKIVHGGWKGMSDYTQHRNEKRRDRFWNRMGGKNSGKAKDPFSPLYWHKRFGTWAEGGQYEGYKEGDVQYDVTTEHTLGNLKNSPLNRGLAVANTLSDPRNMAWALPNKGLLGQVKAVAGLASGLSGAALGYSKMFAKPKTESFISNDKTKEYGKMSDIIAARQPKPDPSEQIALPSAISTGSGMGNYYMNSIQDEQEFRDMGVFKRHGGNVYQEGGPKDTFQQWYAKNATRMDVMRNSANQALLMEMWKKETGQSPAVPAPGAATPVTNTTTPATTTTKTGNTYSSTQYGDPAGIMAANNAIAGLSMFNAVLGAADYERQYEQMLRRTGNTDSRYNAENPTNPFGNYTLNAGPASNFALVTNTPMQDFGTGMAGAKYGGTTRYEEGGVYYASEDEIKQILAAGGEIEFLD